MCKYTDYAEFNDLVDQSREIRRALVERARAFDSTADLATAYQLYAKYPDKFDIQGDDDLGEYHNLGEAYQAVRFQINDSKRKINKICMAMHKFQGYIRHIQTETAWISVALKLDASILKEKSMMEINNLLSQINDQDIRATLDLHFPLNPKKNNLDYITVGIMDQCIFP